MTITRTTAQSTGAQTPSRRRLISFRDILKTHYSGSPHFLSTVAFKTCAAIGAPFLVEIEGRENLENSPDPAIYVLNHNQKLEALYVPGLLIHLRKGNPIHFMADWNFCLVPGVWFFYHYGQVITIARKPAKPRFLNIFKPLFTSSEPAFSRAQRLLEQGRSVGVFPEGTTNRHPTELLKGFNGPAQLSLQSQVPVLPVGIRFPDHDRTKPIPECIPVGLKIGRPMAPPAVEGKPKLKEIRAWHREIMTAIADLSGKSWQAQNRRK